jgi:hypothetical protein
MLLERVGVWALVCGLAACGGRENNISDNIDARPRADAAPVIDAGPIVPGVDGAVSTANGPTVVVVSPAAGEVVSGQNVVVVCDATPNTTTNSPVVAMTVTVAGAGAPVLAGTATLGLGDVWQASVPVATFGNGPLVVSCNATSADDGKGHVEQTAALDLGPRIVVSRPLAGSAQHGQLDIDFEVLASPISTDDTMAGVTSVSADLASHTVTLTDAGGGRRTASVKIDDPEVFKPILAGDQILRIIATNQRGVTRELVVPIFVDNLGPVITLTSPEAGEMVGGLMLVEAEVVDEPGGVRPGSVVAVIANGVTPLAEFPLTSADGTTWSGVYPTGELRAVVEEIYGPTAVVVFPTVSVRARDIPGNEASVGMTVVLDYTPPVASLDPPMVREGALKDGVLECSRAFDPVGIDATNDLQSVRQISEFRARIEDRGNLAPTTSGVVFYFAGVDDTQVQLFVLDNTDEAVGLGDALVVDTDGDGRCDDINPMLRPTSGPVGPSDALAVQMTPLSGAGNAWFLEDPAGYAGYPGCTARSGTFVAPNAVCLGASGLQRVIERPATGSPEIYTIAPVDDEGACMGFPFDSLANDIQDGWACVAVRVVDNLGNVGVSRPLRVCIDRDGDGSDGCPALPSYNNLPDLPYGTATVPTLDPGIDCTGRYRAGTLTQPESSDATDDCDVLPPAFATGEVLRTDL